MPVITVRMFEGRTQDQKEQFAQAVTKASEEILKTSRDHVWIVFEESPKSEWAMGGKMCNTNG